MRLRFTKMEALGNDFLVIDARDKGLALNTSTIRWLADRRLGVGCDQLLLLSEPEKPESKVYYRIFNTDGSEAEQCGNGARCIARYLIDNGAGPTGILKMDSLAGTVRTRVGRDGLISLDVGAPRFEPAAIPFEAEEKAERYELNVAGELIEIGAVSIGNPHAVIETKDLAAAPVAIIGAQIERHPRFPQQANVGFMEIQDRDSIRLRVYERGVGETRACGTGACAAVAVGVSRGALDSIVSVDLPGGRLMVSWQDEQSSMWLKGPAERVFEGRIDL